MGFDVKNIVERFFWTAIQAFAGALPSTIMLTNLSDWKAAGVAGLTAAIAAVISLAKNLTAEGIAVQATKRAATAYPAPAAATVPPKRSR